MTLEAQFAGIVEEHGHSVAAPLSLRKSLLVAVLLDHFADAVFARFRSAPDRVLGAADVLEWRAALARRSEAVALVGELASGRHDRATWQIDTVIVPIADYARLSVPDYMVSLYNNNSVQRATIVRRDGSTVPAQDTLAAAMEFWRAFDWR